MKIRAIILLTKVHLLAMMHKGACRRETSRYGVVRRSGVMTLVLLFILCVTAGCNTPETIIADINRAERYVEEHPDSAIMILQGIDRHDIRDQHIDARYAMVYSEALYYSRVESTSDSLTRPMADYYLFVRDNHSERARALYQHALVLNRQNRSIEALSILLEAEHSIEAVDNPRLAGMIHNTIGSIYGSQCLLNNALESYYTARDYFQEAELEYHIIYATYHIGETYLLKQEYDAAEEYLCDVVNRLDPEVYSGLMCHVLHKLCDLYIQTSRIDKCVETISLLHDYDCQIFFDNHYYLVCAVVESYSGNADKAIEYLNLADAYDDDYNAEVEHYKYLTYNNIGDIEQALYWQTMSKRVQDQLMLQALDSATLNAQLDLLEQDRDIIAQRMANMQRYYIALVVLCIVAIIAIIVYMYLRIKRHKGEINRYISSIENLQQMLDNAALGSPSEDTLQIYDIRFSEFNKLFDVYYNYNTSSKQKLEVFNQLTDIIKSMDGNDQRIAELEKIVNLRYDNIMVIIDEACPKLSVRMRHVVLYHLAGFSLRAISLFIDSTPVAVSKIRYKIKAEIRSSNHPSAERIVELL